MSSSADLTRYINQYSVGTIPKEHEFLDTYTGDFKDAKLEGGVMNVLFGGLLTNQDSLIHYINPKENLFAPLTDRLRQDNWDDSDFCYFTYGEEKKTDFKAEYDASDTARSIEENEKYAISQIEKIMDYSPLMQFNLIGHSLGGVFAMAVARKYPDSVNNLIFLSSPVRGMDSNPIRMVIVSFVRDRYIKPIAGDEKVSAELVKRWGDPDYQKNLDKFALSFTARGGKIGIASSKDDPIVLSEYTKLPKASEIEVSVGGGNIFDFLAKPVEAVRAHGRTIDNLQVLDFEASMIGKKAA